MLHIIFTILMIAVAIAVAWFAIYVVLRLFKTAAPNTVEPSPKAGAESRPQ